MHSEIKLMRYGLNPNLGLQLRDKIDITLFEFNHNSGSPRLGPNLFLGLWSSHTQKGPMEDYPQTELFIQTPKLVHKHKPKHAP